MSIAIAVEKDGHVAVGADTLVTVGSSTSPNLIAQPKVVRAQNALVATAGLSVYYPLLRKFFDGDQPIALTCEAEIVDAFVTFWKFLREHCHFVNDQSDTDDLTPFADLQAEFLVASHSGLFHVREILSVLRYERFCAIGSGASHAEGAACILFEQQRGASDIARLAVEVACRFNRASGGEVVVYELDKR